MTTDETVTADMRQAVLNWEKSMAAYRLFTVCCTQHEWTEAELQRTECLLRLEANMDLVAHAHRTLEIAGG